MKKLLTILFFTVLLHIATGNVQAAYLIGDEITLEHRVDSLLIDNAPTRIVAAGPSDVWLYPSWQPPANPFYVVNPEDTSILVNFAPAFEESNTLFFRCIDWLGFHYGFGRMWRD